MFVYGLNSDESLVLNATTKYLINDYIIECKVVFDRYREKILNTSYIDIDSYYLRDNLEIGSILISPIKAVSNTSALSNNNTIDSECYLLPVVKIIDIEDYSSTSGEIRIYVEEPKHLFEYIQKLGKFPCCKHT